MMKVKDAIDVYGEWARGMEWPLSPEVDYDLPFPAHYVEYGKSLREVVLMQVRLFGYAYTDTSELCWQVKNDTAVRAIGAIERFVESAALDAYGTVVLEELSYIMTKIVHSTRDEFLDHYDFYFSTIATIGSLCAELMERETPPNGSEQHSAL